MLSKSHKNLSYKAIHDIYEAQVLNVKELENAWVHINRTINHAYRIDDSSLVKHQTRMLALVFCAYAEANFSKLIHTPYGLNTHEISQVKKAQKRSIVKAWKECLRVSTKKIQSKKSKHIPNLIQETNRLITSYIEEPSLIRNKIAHGQWAISLNSDNTKINDDLTQSVKKLTVVDLSRFKAAFDKLNAILEDIIESPNKAHWKFYWAHIVEFDQEQERLKKHTVAGKIAQIKKKEGYKNISSVLS
jgi:hypothetical protein